MFFSFGATFGAAGMTMLAGAQSMMSDVSLALAADGAGLASGDMAAIQRVAFGLSTGIAIAGLWMLIRPRVLLLGRQQAAAAAESVSPEEEEALPAPSEEDTERPIRLLEAVAAAKAQMAISESERKHAS